MKYDLKVKTFFFSMYHQSYPLMAMNGTTEIIEILSSSRVIHSYVVYDKLEILLLFWPVSESFGK